VVAEAVFAMEPLGGAEFAEQRSGGARENGNIGVADFSAIEGVVHPLGNGYITGDYCYGRYANRFGTKGHDQGYGVIGSGVGVDEEGARHFRSKHCTGIGRNVNGGGG
jgi:hypothetical protein